MPSPVPKRPVVVILSLILISFAVARTVSKGTNTQEPVAAKPSAPGDVVTFHNDNSREGLNSTETILNTHNVAASGFGKLFSFPVDGVIDAQPLYLSSVNISGQGTHNVVYAVTENDSVYAFDGDDGTPLWHVSVIPSGETPSGSLSCFQITPQIGITSTPVIDRSAGPNGTIYLVAMSKNSSGQYFQRLHALDITTGQEEFGGPTTIQAKYPGTGDGSQNGYVVFNPQQYAERAGLTLLNHVIYTAWTSHCDFRPYTGWIMGFDQSTLKLTQLLNVTPNGNEGAIWQSGAGLVTLGNNLIFLDANGTFDTQLNSKGFPAKGDYGNAFLRVSTNNNKLTVADYFTMHNTVGESGSDTDLGSGGALLVPPMKDSNGTTRYLGVGAGKDGNIYIADLMNMGKFNPNNDNALYQEIDGVLGGGLWSMPAYFNGNVYFGPQGGKLLGFRFTDAKLSTGALSQSAATFPYPGTTPSISAHGTAEGIVWTLDHRSPAVLHAYDAMNLNRELYNSSQAGTRDQFGDISHFGTPTIVNGKVYVGTTNGVAVFGLLGQ
jgi:hypothetical protein